MADVSSMPSWTLTRRQLCDLEMILNGAFSPLTGFMGSVAYAGVVKSMRLPSGVLWPVPITLDVDAATAGAWTQGLRVVLRDSYHNPLAVLTVDEVYLPDKRAEVLGVFGPAADATHPGVAYLQREAGQYYVGGPLRGLALPRHFEFASLRPTPRELRGRLEAAGAWANVAFQTRNPMHRAHIELTRLAAAATGAHVLITPVVGMTKPGDVDAAVRVRCYQALLDGGRYYAPGGAGLVLLPLAMRMAGPREALWHAIVRRNYGASHFIVGRDHAGVSSGITGDAFYGPYEAQELVRAAAVVALRCVLCVYVRARCRTRRSHGFAGTEVPSRAWRARARVQGTDVPHRLGRVRGGGQGARAPCRAVPRARLRGRTPPHGDAFLAAGALRRCRRKAERDAVPGDTGVGGGGPRMVLRP